MSRFMIMMFENDRAWSRLPAEEQQRLLQGYYKWVEELRASGCYDTGSPMSNEGRVLRVVEGEVVDGPFTETKEVMTGFFIVKADDLDQATEIARGCPGLGHGETVIVRQIDTH
jgi:hypothetical protein